MNNEKQLSDTQRKALVELVQKRYARRVSEAKDKEGKLAEEITEKVKVELGVDTLDNQIETLKRQLDNQTKTLEKQIENLEDKKEKLGFSEYGRLMGGSKAQLLIEGRVKKESREIVKLETELEKNLTGIWTASTVEEARKLANV